MSYKGTIIEESLKDKSLIKKLKVLGSEVSSDGEWHMYTVEINEERIKEISRNLNAQKWYVHFWKGQEVIVAFKDKVMRFEYDKKESWKPVVEYGLSIGIPKEQLDFPIGEKMKTILIDAVDAFVIEENGKFRIFEEMQKMLEGIPNRKIILTGANDEQFKKFGLDKMPYEVFTLKHNPEKTDPNYYKMMLEHFGLSKDDVIYFEHNPEAVKSARSVGIRSYHYDSAKRDLLALKKFLEGK